MFLSMLWLGGITALASAQTPESTYGHLQETYAAAEASAVRPGDENLDCDGFATELVAVAKDSAVQAYIAKAGAAARKQYAAMNAAAAAMAAQSAFTLFGSIVPGGGWAGHSAAVDQAEAQKLQAARNIQLNGAYAEFFGSDRAPARSTVQGDRWPEGHLVAMEAIALEP
jgi:hypothetical protein